MNFGESPETEKDYPGMLYGVGSENDADDEKSSKKRQKRKKDKDKGYAKFEEEDSDQEELMVSEKQQQHHHHSVVDDLKSPSSGSKLKKNKPSFRFPGTKLGSSGVGSTKDKEHKEHKTNEKEQKRREKLEKEKERQEKERLEKEKEKLQEKQEKVSKKLEKEKERKERKKKKHSSSSSGVRIGSSDLAKEADDRAVFGVPLEVAIERSRLPDGVMLPRVFRECIEDVEERGLYQQGIYRISGVKSKVQKLKEAYNRGKPVYLPDYDPHIVAGLLKLFLRELPEPVLTPSLNSKFDEACVLPDEKSRIERFVVLVAELPSLNKLLLSWTIVHMVHVIEREKVNKMSLENVSIVLSPTMKISHRVLNVFFSHSRVFFAEDTLKKFVPTIRHDASRVSLEIPETTSSVEEELKRQQTILDKLHDELLAGVKDRTKEEELWEVQRVVTTLKRKLRQMKKDDAAAATSAAAAVAASSAAAAATVDEGADEKVDVDAAAMEEQQRREHDDALQATNVTTAEEPADEEDTVASVREEGTPIVQDEDTAQKTFEDVKTEVTSSSSEKEQQQDEVQPDIDVEEEKDEDYADMGHDQGYKALVEALLEEEQKLVLETEELNQLGEELRRKIESEKSEIERLKEEMEEIRLRRAQSLEDVEKKNQQMMAHQLQQQQQQQQRGVKREAEDLQPPSAMTGSVIMRSGSAGGGSDGEESNYSGGSGSESELDEEELHQLLQSLISETDRLFREKRQITVQIETERTKCMNYKIQIRLMQWRTERLMTLQQKRDEKLLRDKPLMPVVASTLQPKVTVQQPQQQQQQRPRSSSDMDDPLEKRLTGDLAESLDNGVVNNVINGHLDVSDEVFRDESFGKDEEPFGKDVDHRLRVEDDDDDVRSSPIEVTQF